MANSKGNRASDILEQTESHLKEVAALKKKLKSTEEKLERTEQSLKDERAAKYKGPKGKRTKSKKTDYIRFVIPDVHGCKMHRPSVSAMLGDLESLNPKEIVILGDFLDCGGFLAQHHTLGYVEQSTYSFDQDVAAAND